MPFESSVIVFWIFVMVAVVAGIAHDILTRREAQKTLRFAIEKEQRLDVEVVDRILGKGPRGKKTTNGFMIVGTLIIGLAVGVSILGTFLSIQFGMPIYPVFGASALLICVGIAFLVISRVLRRQQPEPDMRARP